MIIIKDDQVSYDDLPDSLQQYVQLHPLGLEYRMEWDDMHWHTWENIKLPGYVRELRIRAVQLAFVVQRMVTSAFLNVCAGRPLPLPTNDPEARLTYSLRQSMIMLARWHNEHPSVDAVV